MMPIDFKEANAIFGKPKNMSDDECLPVSAYVGQDQNGNPYTNTVWMPNKEDIEAINAGRPIVLSIYGGGLPPVALFTCDENGNPNG